MSYLETHSLQHSTIQSIYSEWEAIVPDPPYQRNGDIWSLEKKRLLIDSIINRYDIPKIYFHKYDREKARKTKKNYAIIDGRQRLETIINFIDNGFTLAEDFEYLEDSDVQVSGLNYSELAQKYPKIKSRFDAFSLPIITVETDDLELIEDMFSRLNEAVPLNAAEKRRSIGGDMVRAIDEISQHVFFKKKVKFKDSRYQHKETAVRLLFIEFCLRNGKLIDTKKPYLDKFAADLKSGKAKLVKSLRASVKDLLDVLSPVFIDKDPLLIAQASVPIYAFVLSTITKDKGQSIFSRSKLEKFGRMRTKNRDLAEKDLGTADFELLEYDRLSQQGTNDANSIRERWRILESWLLKN